jgi:hypothetical protein
MDTYMPEERDLPAPGTAEPTPQTFDEQVAGISDLLEDPVTDPPEDDQDQAKADEPVAEDDPLGLGEPEDVENEETAKPDGSEDSTYKGGQFVPDTGKVTLDDGTTITVAELKRNNLYQRGFTEKTTKLAEERKAFEAERQQVTEYAQSLNELRDYATWYAEQHLPKQPEPFKGDASADPHGFILWQQKQRQWEEHVQAFHAFKAHKEAEDQRKNEELTTQNNKRVDAEFQSLQTAIPILKNPAKVKPFFDSLIEGAASHYGFSQQDVLTAIAGNHKMGLALRDALAYRQIKAKAPQVREEVHKRPPMNGGKRQDPRAQVGRDKQVRSERLRQSGTFEDGVAALQDLDL